MASFASSRFPAKENQPKQTPTRIPRRKAHGRPPLVNPAGTVARPHRPGVALPSDGDPTPAPGADARAGPTLTRPALHPERISSRRAPSPPNGHPPRVRGRPQTRGPGAARAGYKTAGHSPPGSRIPARAARSRSSPTLTVSSPCSAPHTRSPLPPSLSPLLTAARAPCRFRHVWHLRRARVRRLLPGPEGSRPRLLPQASTPLHCTLPLVVVASTVPELVLLILGLLNMWLTSDYGLGTGNCSFLEKKKQLFLNLPERAMGESRTGSRWGVLSFCPGGAHIDIGSSIKKRIGRLEARG